VKFVSILLAVSTLIPLGAPGADPAEEASLPLVSGASATEPYSTTGIAEARLLTPARAIRPASRFTVGLLLRPEPGFHTYWRGPGIVGVATKLDWTFPEGFEAGDILWPPPEKTDMAGVTANGYRSEVILLTDIEAPEEIGSDTVTIDLSAAWMACSTSCHPSIAKFSLTLPVARGEADPPKDVDLAARFSDVRNSIPGPHPEDWTFSITAPAEDRLVLEGSVPGLEEASARELVFFGDDMQVDSDEPRRIEWVGDDSGTFRMHFVRPDFAPANPERFSGLLRLPPFGDSSSPRFVEISLPWKPGTEHE